MGIDKRNNLKKRSVNFFGGLGYFVCCLSWLWTAMVYVNLLEKYAPLPEPEIKDKITATVPTTDPETNIFLVIFAGILVLSIVALALYVFFKTPSTVAKVGKKITHAAANSTAPVVIQLQHKKDTPKNRKKLTFKLVLIIKMLLVFIPVGFSFGSQWLEKQAVDLLVVMSISLLLTGFSLGLFAIQYLLAKLLSIKRQNLW